MSYIFALVMSACLWAAADRIEIDSKLMYQGSKVASPRFSAEMGKISKIVINDHRHQREFSLEVNPLRVGSERVRIEYALTVRKPKAETMSRGSILIPQNENGLISLDKGRIQVYLKIKDS